MRVFVFVWVWAYQRSECARAHFLLLLEMESPADRAADQTCLDLKCILWCPVSLLKRTCYSKQSLSRGTHRDCLPLYAPRGGLRGQQEWHVRTGSHAHVSWGSTALNTCGDGTEAERGGQLKVWSQPFKRLSRGQRPLIHVNRRFLLFLTGTHPLAASDVRQH